MRLRDILDIFSVYCKDISLAVLGIANDGNNKKVIGISKFRTAIEQIEETGAFNKEIDDIRKLNEAVFLSPEDVIVLNKEISEKIISLVGQLQKKIEVSSSVLTAILPSQDHNSISIKLPKINRLKDLSELSERLDKVFDQLLVNDFVIGEAKLQNFDTGSEWIEIVFSSSKALGLVVSLIYAVIFLKREHIKNQELLEVVRNRKVTNDIYENLSKELLEKNRKLLLEEQAVQIADEAGAKNNPEYIERVKFCINELNILIDKGLKFFPVSISPSEIQSKLPNFSRSNIEEMIPEMKKIPERTSESATTEESKP